MLKKVKDFIDRFDVRSYGYVVNRWITNGAFLLMVVYLALVVRVDGVDSLRGEVWGDKPSFLARSFAPLLFIVFGFALLLNHLLYNRNFMLVKK